MFDGYQLPRLLSWIKRRQARVFNRDGPVDLHSKERRMIPQERRLLLKPAGGSCMSPGFSW